MSYQTFWATGDEQPITEISDSSPNIEKLTASQGARSSLYEVSDSTGKIFRQLRTELYGPRIGNSE